MIFKPYCISRAFFACVAWPTVLPRVCRRDDVVGGAAQLVQRRRRSVHRNSRVCDTAALCTVDAATTVEVGMVKEVEHVKAELDAHTLTPYPPVLVDGEVGIYIPRSVAISNRLQILVGIVPIWYPTSVTEFGFSTCDPPVPAVQL